jgi:hypothetical protein
LIRDGGMSFGMGGGVIPGNADEDPYAPPQRRY